MIVSPNQTQRKVSEMASSPRGTASADARSLPAEVVITLGGIVTTVATVGINLLLAETLGFNILSLALWLVIPAGAIVGGMAAASGYYVTARMTQTMPTRTLLINMIAVALSAWLLARWLGYITSTFDDGSRIADVMSFWTYFQVSLESTQLTIRGAGSSGVTTGELGTLGYVREILQIAGFSLGGFVTYTYLCEVESCKDCRKYASRKAILKNVEASKFDSALAEMAVSLPGVADDAVAALQGKPLRALSLYLYQCPKCRSDWLRPAVVVGGGPDAQERQLNRYSVDADRAKRVREYKPSAVHNA